MIRTILSAAALAAVTSMTLTASPASAVQVERADRTVSQTRVTYTEQTSQARMFVELNNGAAYRLAPCRQEDSRGCYWDASTAGNGVGHSFVSVHVGRSECTLYLSPSYARTHNYCTAVAR